MKRAVAFPGQGSQREKMGLDLVAFFPEKVEMASRILGYEVVSFLEQANSETLKQTQYTQPMVFLVSALAFLLYKKKKGDADFYLGHSVGEYTALFAAQALSFTDTLRLVKKRAELMHQLSLQCGGGMIAVLGKTLEEVQAMLASSGLEAYIANHNEEKQVVIAAGREAMEPLAIKLKQNRAKFRWLEVSAPFHSPFMDQAAQEFSGFIKAVTFQPPVRPVVCNATGKVAKDPETLKHSLLLQLNHPVRWVDSLKALQKEGVKAFIEIGPGQVLSRMAKRFCPEWEIKSYQTKDDLEEES